MIYQLLTRSLQMLPPEMAHHTAIKLLRFTPVPNMIRDIDVTILSQRLMGVDFPHPLGLAAGFDKDAEVFDKLGQLGFSFVKLARLLLVHNQAIRNLVYFVYLHNKRSSIVMALILKDSTTQQKISRCISVQVSLASI